METLLAISVGIFMISASAVLVLMAVYLIKVMAARTIENCSVIRRAVAEGVGEPERYWNLNKCLGYCHSDNDDEPIESCKNCKYYVSFEQEG